ncbi:chlorophyll synthase ChlG [Rubrimonas cliftonensis]|uniref:Chlorophyll synthase n=1 Tax=Rubrimonas cliftonensis TaxID=89524 RepID=A0A1H3VZ49_9RHOB|nr:chlorophyll synthase ChlG [Rubrimonas cliftonensis]SDZ80079.1 chlorophyll synthase [Rubrimonas cliftonensis]
MAVSENLSEPGDARGGRLPDPRAVLTLLKPVTWFPPMWAYFCGVVSTGAAFGAHWEQILLGVLLAGPLVCGMSQAANDWCDRHVDAINEPHRPIPSGRVPGRWGLWIALVWTALSLALGWALGPWAFGATALAVLAAWAYSAEPIRLKRNGWWSAGVCGLSYETLPWITGAAVVTAAAPDPKIFAIAILYGLGAHGIMTLNDFKSVEGDVRFGLGSLPARLGVARAARVACWAMAVPQAVVVALLWLWDTPWNAAIVAVLLLGQLALMRRLMTDPKALAPWFNGTGVVLYVLGMLTSACALHLIGRG